MKILQAPTTPTNKSQTAIIGANMNPILCVPQGCSTNRPINITHAEGTGTSGNQLSKRSRGFHTAWLQQIHKYLSTFHLLY